MIKVFVFYVLDRLYRSICRSTSVRCLVGTFTAIVFGLGSNWVNATVPSSSWVNPTVLSPNWVNAKVASSNWVNAKVPIQQAPNARILFIDLNNAPAEIAAARRALDRKVPIDVWPTFSEINDIDRKKVYDIGVKAATVDRILTEKAVVCSQQPDTIVCVNAWQTLRSLEIERQRLTQHIKLDHLKALLNKTPDGYTMVVMSGHHENGFFDGELTRIDLNELQGIISEHAQPFERLRTVLLLGCDTALDRLLQTRVRPIFPSATLLIGAEGSAPTRNETRNLRFIERVIKLEPKLVSTKQATFIRRSVAKLRAEIWPVAMLWGDVYSAGTDTEKTVPLTRLVRNAARRANLN